MSGGAIRARSAAGVPGEPSLGPSPESVLCAVPLTCCLYPLSFHSILPLAVLCNRIQADVAATLKVCEAGPLWPKALCAAVCTFFGAGWPTELRASVYRRF